MSSPASPASAVVKSYDQAYFKKWYHDARTRVHTPDSVRRKVRMVVGITEYFLRRKVRSVLDIGAGEGAWRAELRRLRPDIRYLGIDPSEYVIRRHGKRRNIRLGRFEDLPALSLGARYDLVVCADVLQYVATPAVERGVERIREILGGVAFLEAYTSGDEMEGDLSGWHPRSKAQYRRLFDRAGLVGCGLHCYLTPELAERAVELELV
jgi:SAM-dependent methyltransferase